MYKRSLLDLLHTYIFNTIINGILNFMYVYAFILRLFTFFYHVGRYHKNFLRIQCIMYISMNITKESCISRAKDSLPLLLCTSCRQFSKTNFEFGILSNTSCSKWHVQPRYIYAWHIHVRKKSIHIMLVVSMRTYTSIAQKNLVLSYFQVAH